MKKIFTILFILLTTSFAWAKTNQEIYNNLLLGMQTVRSGYQTSVSMMDIAQMANDSHAYQLAAYEKGLHEQMYSYLENLSTNPGALQNPQYAAEVRQNFAVYLYRVQHRDYRSYQEIQPALQQWLAQREWEVSTPEGQQAYANRQQQNWNAFYAHQNQMNQANANFSNYMDGLQAAQNQRDKDHHQYVNTIHDRYEYVNPNNGQSYMYPNTQSQYPVVQNPDGTYTQLIPYQNY